uniref:Uncharacterized protein n=1 Tax=Monomastix sp. (strain OKE-1) TaxID=141716 RepID=U5YGM3_MONSK|nr:hypothetical protein [Monomastix sp. OKE-1]AGZ90226.1 hypothetical protein [Monomastix sp. OKE-1]
MSLSPQFFRKHFLQKKLMQKVQLYPYTYIFQYNNISANDWKHIKNTIHLHHGSTMNIQIIPSKLRKSLHDSVQDNRTQSQSALFFDMKGRCCFLNCTSPAALEVFYQIIHHTVPTKELKTQSVHAPLHVNSFFHVALDSCEKNNHSTLLNVFDIKKRLGLSETSVYAHFFQTVHLPVLNTLSLPNALTQRILWMKAQPASLA